MTHSWKGAPEGRARVAVTGVGGNVGQGVLKALAHARIASWVVGTDAQASSAGLYLVDRGYRIPLASSPEFKDAFCRILETERIDIAFVAADAETIHLAHLRDDIQRRTGTRVLVADADVVERCHDKWLAAQWCADAGVPHPATVRADDTEGVRRLCDLFGGHLVVKPRCGFGSRGVTVVKTEAEALTFAGRLGEDGIVQQHVGTEDQEYTSAALCDGDGKPLAVAVMWRELNLGTSYRVYPACDPALQSTVHDWAARLKAAGPINFQFRMTKDGPICFEINPRFSGTTGLRFHFGYNDVEMAVRHFVFGEEVAQPELCQGVVLRYWDEVFIPSTSWPDMLDADRVVDGIPLGPHLRG